MEQRDVVIVGGGPAGLSAAGRLAELGVTKVTVLEREVLAGGVPRHCGHTGFGWASHRRVWSGPAFAQVLRRSADGLDVRTGTTVLSIKPDNILRIRDHRGIAEIAARRILLATGTRETPRSARLIGGSRPAGVMNTGALQAHVYLQQFKPFERPVIIGSELVSFSAILTCRHMGIRPVAMIEENPRITAPWPGRFVARLVYGVPVLTAARLVAITGGKQVEAVEIEQNGQTRRIACDGVIVSGRFVPEAELTGQAPDAVLAGNVHGDLKTAGRCWLDGRAAAERIAEQLA